MRTIGFLSAAVCALTLGVAGSPQQAKNGTFGALGRNAVPDAPVAEFAYHSTPSGVQFMDQSTGGRSSTWSWDIEDYDSAGNPVHIWRYVANPLHRFNKPDGDLHDPKLYSRTYNVTLTVTNIAGSSSTTHAVSTELEPPRTVFVRSVRSAADGARLIQDALDLPFPEGLHGAPGTVHLGSGVYQLDSSIRLHSGQKLVGISPPSASWDKGEPQDGTILQYIGTTSEFAIEVDRDAQWCEIRDLFVLDGNLGDPFARGAVHLDAAWHTTLENVLIDEFGSDLTPGSAENLDAGYGVLIEGGLFTRILNCRMRGCDVFIEFRNSANQNMIQGGHYTLSRTNSAVVVRNSTSNTIFGASFEQPGSCDSETFFSFFEFLSGSHTSVIANRLEVCDGNTDMGIASWHYSFDPLSKNNMVFGNQFTDLPSPAIVGKAAIRNVTGAATRRALMTGAMTSAEVLEAAEVGEVVLRFPVPSAWVGTAPTLALDHFLSAGAAPDPITLEVEAGLVGPGDVPPRVGGYEYTGQISSISVAAVVGTSSILLDGLSPVTPDHRYLEVRVRRIDTKTTGPVSIAHVTLAYDATDTPFVRQ